MFISSVMDGRWENISTFTAVTFLVWNALIIYDLYGPQPEPIPADKFVKAYPKLWYIYFGEGWRAFLELNEK